MQFNKETFCPYITDKSTPIKKYLHCSKIDGLCKMVTYSPNGQMIPVQDVKTLGCPYGYVIQGIEKENKVTKKSDVLDDISVKVEKKVDPKQAEQKEVPQKKNTTVKKTTTRKKNTKKKS